MQFFLQQVINLRVRPARHRLNMLCLGWFMSAMSCWVHLAVRSRGFDGGEGVAGGAVGLVSVRFVLQEDWSVAAPRVPTATHTSVINHTQPRSTECFVFPSSHTSAASCHHPERSSLQNNYQKYKRKCWCLSETTGCIYVFPQRKIWSCNTKTGRLAHFSLHSCCRTVSLPVTEGKKAIKDPKLMCE